SFLQRQIRNRCSEKQYDNDKVHRFDEAEHCTGNTGRKSSGCDLLEIIKSANDNLNHYFADDKNNKESKHIILVIFKIDYFAEDRIRILLRSGRVRHD